MKCRMTQKSLSDWQKSVIQAANLSKEVVILKKLLSSNMLLVQIAGERCTSLLKVNNYTQKRTQTKNTTALTILTRVVYKTKQTKKQTE
jgi:hypothetical protein